MALGDFKAGDRGTGVADLQRYLASVGLPVDVDGQFGTQTRAAVLAFQRARGIRADGIAGPETLVELSKARAEGWRVSVAAVAQQPGTPTLTTSPSHEVGAVIPGLFPKPGSKWTGLVILVGLAVAVWIFTAQDRGGSKE